MIKPREINFCPCGQRLNQEGNCPSWTYPSSGVWRSHSVEEGVVVSFCKLGLARLDRVTMPRVGGMRLTLKGAALAMLLLLSPVFGDKKTSINFPQWEIDEMEDAIQRNYPSGLPLESLKYVFYAIRKSENGAKDHLAFGIIDPGCATDSYSEQAGWAICTVVKNYHRWLGKDKGNKLKSVEDFIPYLGAKYCPVGAKNDPTGLNAHWVKNVLFWYKKVQN